jgi:hypothetical protein
MRCKGFFLLLSLFFFFSFPASVLSLYAQCAQKGLPVPLIKRLKDAKEFAVPLDKQFVVAVYLLLWLSWLGSSSSVFWPAPLCAHNFQIGDAECRCPVLALRFSQGRRTEVSPGILLRHCVLNASRPAFRLPSTEMGIYELPSSGHRMGG